jgi:predicted RNA binding protein YcfA (HicA-like mRNA interferase family)
MSDKPWDKENPKSKHKHLTPKQKKWARSNAEENGRPYPNWIDNAAATHHSEEISNEYSTNYEINEKKNPFVIGRTHRDITGHLKKMGWSLAREQGDHEVYSHPKSKNRIAVPKHKGDLAPGTIRDIMRKSVIEKETKPETSDHAHKNSKHVKTPEDSEKQSKNSSDADSRFLGTKSLSKVYKDETPGQTNESTVSVVKRVISEVKKMYQNPEGGLNQAGREHYNRETGSHLKAPVTKKPSELTPGSKSANRRKSFCARMCGVPGPMKDEHGKPTRKALALRKWNCKC